MFLHDIIQKKLHTKEILCCIPKLLQSLMGIISCFLDDIKGDWVKSLEKYTFTLQCCENIDNLDYSAYILIFNEMLWEICVNQDQVGITLLTLLKLQQTTKNLGN